MRLDGALRPHSIGAASPLTIASDGEGDNRVGERSSIHSFVGVKKKRKSRHFKEYKQKEKDKEKVVEVDEQQQQQQQQQQQNEQEQATEQWQLCNNRHHTNTNKTINLNCNRKDNIEHNYNNNSGSNSKKSSSGCSSNSNSNSSSTQSEKIIESTTLNLVFKQPKMKKKKEKFRNCELTAAGQNVKVIDNEMPTITTTKTIRINTKPLSEENRVVVDILSEGKLEMSKENGKSDYWMRVQQSLMALVLRFGRQTHPTTNIHVNHFQEGLSNDHLSTNSFATSSSSSSSSSSLSSSASPPPSPISLSTTTATTTTSSSSSKPLTMKSSSATTALLSITKPKPILSSTTSAIMSSPLSLSFSLSRLHGRYHSLPLYPFVIFMVLTIAVLLPTGTRCDDGDNFFAVNGFNMASETTTEFDYASRGQKKFGDKCENTLECGFPGSICDPKKKSCQCTEDLPVTNHIDKCGKEAAVNESCFFNEQCEMKYFQTECREHRCVCRFEMIPIWGKDGSVECKGRQDKKGPETYIDPAMIGVLVGMALMFIIICVVLRLFSQARWRENRTIFNTPNPRLMNVSLLRDSKLLHGQERRGSRMSMRAPSRQPSMASLRPHSPNPSLGKTGRMTRSKSNTRSSDSRVSDASNCSRLLEHPTTHASHTHTHAYSTIHSQHATLQQHNSLPPPTNASGHHHHQHHHQQQQLHHHNNHNQQPQHPNYQQQISTSSTGSNGHVALNLNATTSTTLATTATTSTTCASSPSDSLTPPPVTVVKTNKF